MAMSYILIIQYVVILCMCCCSCMFPGAAKGE